MSGLRLLAQHEEQVLNRRSQNAVQENKLKDTMRTITDKSEDSHEDEQMDKFNHVRKDKERKGSIDLSALQALPTVRTNLLDTEESH